MARAYDYFLRLDKSGDGAPRDYDSFPPTSAIHSSPRPPSVLPRRRPVPSFRPSVPHPAPPASRRIASAGYLDRLEIQEGLANPDIDWTLLGFDEGVKERHLSQARPVVTPVPVRPRRRGERRFLKDFLPASLSAHPSLSIPTHLDAFQLRF